MQTASQFGVLLCRLNKTSLVRKTTCRYSVRRWRFHSTAIGDDQQHATEGDIGVKGQVEPSPEELQNEEPWMQEEIKAYYRGRKRLAEMMGKDPEAFTDKDVKDSLRYLLPTRLFAEDARPLLKHPSEIFPKRAESLFDATTGRPLEPAFYTGFPAYHNLLYQIFERGKQLEEAEQRLRAQPNPSVPVQSSAGQGGGEGREEIPTEDGVERGEGGNGGRGGVIPKHWVKQDKMADILTETISEKQYEDVISRLQHLSDHPLSSEVDGFLNRFRRSIFVYRSHASIPSVKEEGEEAKAVGRRKTSCALVRVKRGRGQLVINGRPFINYFPRVEDRQQVLYPLITTGLLGQYDVTVTVRGGGGTGQAGAVRLGISKALLAFPGSHGDQLEREGLLVRDPRMVERKKPGQKKARKKFAWVKR